MQSRSGRPLRTPAAVLTLGLLLAACGETAAPAVSATPLAGATASATPGTTGSATPDGPAPDGDDGADGADATATDSTSTDSTQGGATDSGSTNSGSTSGGGTDSPGSGTDSGDSTDGGSTGGSPTDGSSTDSTGGGTTTTPPASSGNTAPVLRPDTDATDEDLLLSVAVLENDEDPEGDDVILVTVASRNGGDASFTEDGVVHFMPPQDEFGTFVLDYTATDGENTASTTLTITVRPVNDPPLAEDDPNMAVPSSPGWHRIPVRQNDWDVEDGNGYQLAFFAITQPARGSLRVTADGLEWQDVGGDPALRDIVFTYTVVDSDGATATANVRAGIYDPSTP